MNKVFIRDGRAPIPKDVKISETMSRIRAKNTKPELALRRALSLVGIKGYEEKGRDIFDLLWYMNNATVPDLDYLLAKDVKEAGDLRTLFDKLTIRMNKVSDANLKQDLLPLFLDRRYIENWLTNWRETYLHLVEKYKICVVTTLESIQVHQHFDTDNFSLRFTYRTEEEEKYFRIRYAVSEYWIDFREGEMPIKADEELNKVIKFTRDGSSSQALPEEKLKQYAALFYQKTESYLKKQIGLFWVEVLIPNSSG